MAQENFDIEFYRQRLNLQTAVFSRIEHEDAMVAIVYKVITPQQEQFVLKISERKNDFFREIYFLKHLENKIPVPKIIQTVRPEEGIHGAILMEYFAGTHLKNLTIDLAIELGRCLALIHQNRLSGYGDPIQEKLNDDPRQYFTYKFEEGLDECSPHLPSDLIKACKDYFESNLHLLSTVDGPCIVHRDFRPGNLLIHDGKLQAVIDWAGARASFAEEDFCSLEHRDWLHEYKNHFLSGYNSIRPIPNFSCLMPLLRLNKAIATIGFTVKRGTWNTVDAKLYQFNHQFLDAFNFIES